MSSLPCLSPALRPISFAFYGSLEDTKGRQPSFLPRTFPICLCTKWGKWVERLHIRHKVQNSTRSLWWWLFCSTGADVTVLGAQEKSICLLEVNFLVTELCFLENQCQPVWIQSIRVHSFELILSLVSVFLGDLELRLYTTSVLNTSASVLSISSPVALSTACVPSIPVVPPPSIWFGSLISNSVNTKIC